MQLIFGMQLIWG